MKTIYKYDLKITDEQFVEIAGFHSFLKVAEQNGNLCLWCIVDTGIKHIYTAEINIVGTGTPVKFKTKIKHTSHLGSVVMSNGLVWHIFAD